MRGDKEVVEIAEICRRLGIQPVELEAMEEEGLITLAAARDGKVLPSEQLDRLEMILRLQRDLSINLAGIDVILEMRGKMIQMRREVDDILDFIRRQISRDVREMLGEEDYPLALGAGEEFLSIGKGIRGRGDAETRRRGDKS
jgi:MerR family transcriptional regulator/heat shock protein HspR